LVTASWTQIKTSDTQCCYVWNEWANK
jgi:hypothetical protein